MLLQNWAKIGYTINWIINMYSSMEKSSVHFVQKKYLNSVHARINLTTIDLHSFARGTVAAVSNW